MLGKNPLLFDRYLSDAIEIDVDALCDGRTVLIAGIMEHIEEAGIHSGDSGLLAAATLAHARDDAASSRSRRKSSRSRSRSAGS